MFVKFLQQEKKTNIIIITIIEIINITIIFISNKIIGLIIKTLDASQKNFGEVTIKIVNIKERTPLSDLDLPLFCSLIFSQFSSLWLVKELSLSLSLLNLVHHC